MNNWITPASNYKEARSGNYRLRRSEVLTGFHGTQDIDHLIYHDTKVPILITRLEEFRNGEWRDWMVDDPANYIAMVKYARESTGHVLTAGLGLCLVAHELVKNDKVESITVVECNEDVIYLTAKYLPKGIELIHGDFWEFIKSSDLDYDTIIADIWASRNIFEQQEPFLTEIMPAFFMLRGRYPKAKLVFHGYPYISDIKLNNVSKGEKFLAPSGSK